MIIINKKRLAQQTPTTPLFNEEPIPVLDNLFWGIDGAMGMMGRCLRYIKSVCIQDESPQKKEPLCAKGHGFLGSLPELWGLDRFTFITSYYQTYGHEGICKVRLGPKSLYLIGDPELADLISRNEKAFQRGGSFTPWRDFSKQGLSEGSYAKENRIKVLHILTPRDLKQFFPIMAKVSDDFVTRWHGLMRQHTPIHLAQESARATLAQMGKTLFNMDCFDLEPHRDELCFRYIDSLNTIFDLVANRILSALPNGIYKRWYSEETRQFETAKRTLSDILIPIFKSYFESADQIDRDSHQYKVLTALGLDLECKAPDYDTLVEQSIGFFQAAFETTSKFMFWGLYELSQHPGIQNRLSDEIERVLSSRSPTLEDLDNMPFLAQVSEEVLRLHPPLPVTLRDIVDPSACPDYAVEKGGFFAISPYLVNRSAKCWENPNDFNPDRFTEEKLKDRWQSKAPGYFTFIHGAHHCPGRKFAKQEFKTFIVRLLQAFCITPSEISQTQGPLQAKIQITLHPKDPYYIQLKPRDKTH